MGNVSTKKDGEECGDFDQCMESSAGRGNLMAEEWEKVLLESRSLKSVNNTWSLHTFPAKGNVGRGKNEGTTGVRSMDFSHYGSQVMGNVGGRINGENLSVMKKSEGFEQCLELRHGASPASMSLPPSHSLGPSLTATILPPQAMMGPSKRLAQLRDRTENGGMFHGRWVTTQIRWSYGGKEVAVEGSWDNWKSKELMPGSGKEFSITKVLPLGIYHFRFIVDGQWRNTPEFPLVYDNTGYAYNVLDLKNYVSDDPESPSSPVSSYNSAQPVAEDFERGPPELPPQAEITPLNGPSFSMDGSQSLTTPQTFVLNHLYIQKMNRKAVALSTTHRFHTKYVTVVLYKPCGG